MAEYLHLGQIGGLSPVVVGSEVWYCAPDTYGRQLDTAFERAPVAGLGDDSPLTMRTPPFAPVGPQGTTAPRRIYLTVGWQFGGGTLQVTPILDFTQRLTAQAFTLPIPTTSGLQKKELEIVLARKCTWVEAEIVVLLRTGRIELLGADLADKPISGAASSVVGVE